MKTISNYLDTMFLNLPHTSEVKQLKIDLLANMEDKYRELKDSGRTENEAIGTVIAEFGNIEEILEELNIPLTEAEEVIDSQDLPVIHLSDALAYIEDKKKIGLGVGAGVLVAAIAVGLFIYMSLGVRGRYVDFSPMGFIPLILFGGIAVGLFIVFGMKNAHYEFLQKGFVMTESTRQTIEAEKKAYERSHIVSIVMGIGICLISLLPLLFNLNYNGHRPQVPYGSIALLLIIAAVGVLLFIYSGNIYLAYNILLDFGEKRQPSPLEQKLKKQEAAFEAIYWPIVVVIFFLWSFAGHSNRWSYTWVIFPLAGALQEAVKQYLKSKTYK